jgi:hypothetical protein
MPMSRAGPRTVTFSGLAQPPLRFQGAPCFSSVDLIRAQIPTPQLQVFTFPRHDRILFAVSTLFSATYYYRFFGYNRWGPRSRAVS